MDLGLITLILNIVLLVFILWGFLWGLGRGAKRSAVRFAYFLGFVIIFALFSMLISKALLGIEITQLNGTVQQILEEKIVNSSPQIADLYNNNPAVKELITSMPAVIVNLVVFIVLVILAKFFSWIGYKITCAIHFKKPNTAPKGKFGDKLYTVVDGKPVVMTVQKEKKHRLVGGLIGAVQGIVILFVLFLPVSGIIRTAGQYIDLSTTASAESVVYAEDADFEYAETSKFIKENLPDEAISVFKAYNNSIVNKIFSVGDFDLKCFDTISTIKVNGERVTLRTELNTAVTVTEGVLYVKNVMDDATLNFKDLDFEKLEKAISVIFDSGLVKTVGMDLLNYYLDKAVAGELLPDSEMNKEIELVLKDIKTNLSGGEDKKIDSSTVEVLKSDALALVGVARAVCESGLLDYLLDENNPVTFPIVYEKLTPSTHNYISDIYTKIFSSETLKTALVSSINNIGLVELEKSFNEIIAEQEGVELKDLAEDKKAKFDRVKNCSELWTSLTNNLTTMTKNAYEIYLLVSNVDFSKAGSFDGVKNIVSSAYFDNALTGCASIVSKLTGENSFFTTTVGGNNLYTQIAEKVVTFDRVKEFGDFSILASVDIGEEFSYLKNAVSIVKEIMINGNDNPTTDDYINRAFESTTLGSKSRINQVVTQLFEGKIGKLFVKNVLNEFILPELLVGNENARITQDISSETGGFNDLDVTINSIINNIYAILTNLKTGDKTYSDVLDEFKADGFKTLLNSSLIGDADNDGNLILAGKILDAVSQISIFNYGTGATAGNVYKDLLTKYGGEFSDYIDVQKAIISTDKDFWTKQCNTLKPAFDIFVTKNVIINGNETNALVAVTQGEDVSDVLKTLTESEIETLATGLIDCDIIRPLTQFVLNTTNSKIMNLITSYTGDVVTDTTDLKAQKTSIINVLKTGVALLNASGSSFDIQSVIEDNEKVSTLTNFLRAIQANSKFDTTNTNKGIFDTAYTTICSEIKTKLNDANDAMYSMLGETASSVVISNDNLLAQWDEIVAVIQNASKFSSGSFTVYDLINSTNSQNFKNLLLSLKTNGDTGDFFNGAYAVVGNKLTTEIRNARNTMITSVGGTASGAFAIDMNILLGDAWTEVTNVLNKALILRDALGASQNITTILSSATNAEKLDDLMISLKINNDTGDIFAGVYDTIKATIDTRINDFNEQIRVMIGESSPISALVNATDEYTLKENQAVLNSALDLEGVNNVNDLFNATNKDNTIALLTAMQSNANASSTAGSTALFEPLYTSIFNYLKNYSGDDTTLLYVKTQLTDKQASTVNWSTIFSIT